MLSQLALYLEKKNGLLYRKINSRYIKDLNVENKIVKSYKTLLNTCNFHGGETSVATIGHTEAFLGHLNIKSFYMAKEPILKTNRQRMHLHEIS